MIWEIDKKQVEKGVLLFFNWYFLFFSAGLVPEQKSKMAEARKSGALVPPLRGGFLPPPPLPLPPHFLLAQ